MQSRPCSCHVHSVQDVAYDGDPIIVTEQNNLPRRVSRCVDYSKTSYLVPVL